MDGCEMKLEKGMIVSPDSCWYIVVEAIVHPTEKINFHCICDHANNIHSWPLDSIHSYMTLKEIGNLGWGKPEREIDKVLRDRMKSL